MNQQKGAIDACLAMLRDLDNGALNEEGGGGGAGGGEGQGQGGGAAEMQSQQHEQRRAQQRASLQQQLDEAKLTYRAGYMELQLCKRQIAEAQTLKKRAMAGLVGAFDRLASSTRVPLP